MVTKEQVKVLMVYQMTRLRANLEAMVQLTDGYDPDMDVPVGTMDDMSEMVAEIGRGYHEWAAYQNVLYRGET